jgi:hypothetical protein
MPCLGSVRVDICVEFDVWIKIAVQVYQCFVMNFPCITLPFFRHPCFITSSSVFKKFSSASAYKYEVLSPNLSIALSFVLNGGCQEYSS